MTKTTHQLSIEIVRSRIKTWSVFSPSLGMNLLVFLNYPQEYSLKKTYLHTKKSLESKKLTKEHPEKVITILDKSCIV